MVGNVEDLRLIRTDSGSLIASWNFKDGCPEVRVSWGRSPIAPEHDRVLVVDAHQASIELHDGVEGRTYVSVGAVDGRWTRNAGERLLPFSGPANFRDLGGYRTSTGQRTRWGIIFRSDALRLQDDDLPEFERLNIRTIWDLRSELEQLRYPNRPAALQPRCLAVPLLARPSDGGLDIEPGDDAERFLAQLYVGILDQSALLLGQIFQGLAHPDSLPTVVHCAGGKDRTGLVSALLLALLGVRANDILDDYELSSRLRPPRRAAALIRSLQVDHQLSPALAAGLIGTSRWAMNYALSVVNERFGGIESYLRERAGVSELEIRALQTRLLE